jgi:hypothetical protein
MTIESFSPLSFQIQTSPEGFIVTPNERENEITLTVPVPPSHKSNCYTQPIVTQNHPAQNTGLESRLPDINQDVLGLAHFRGIEMLRTGFESVYCEVERLITFWLTTLVLSIENNKAWK